MTEITGTPEERAFLEEQFLSLRSLIFEQITEDGTFIVSSPDFVVAVVAGKRCVDGMLPKLYELQDEYRAT